MKKLLLLKSLLLLCALIVGSGSVWAEPITLFHESFGDNSGSARDWSDTYSSKSGVSAVYSGASYTVTNAKQSKNTMGQTKSALVSGQGKTGTFIVGPLNTSNYTSLAVTNYFGMSAGSWANSSFMRMSYSTNGSTYTNVSRTDSNNPTGAVNSNKNLVQASYTLPAAAQSTTLYLKFEFYCYQLNKSNSEIGQAYLDEVELSGVETSGPITYSVTYNGNGNTSGDVPTDNTAYSSGATVTVLGNGSLAKAHCSFSGWNTQPDGNGTNYSAGATFSITANTTLYAMWTDNRTSAGLAWSAASASVKYGAGDNVFPTLTNTHGVDVTYTSLDHSVATIDENGIITLKNITKSTTICALFAGNDDYLPQTETYTLNVNYGIEDGIFDFVNAGNASPLEHFGSGVNLETNSSNYITEEKTWTAGNVTMVTSGKYRWWYNGCELKLYNNTPKSAATFSVPDGYVITKIVTTTGNFTNITSGGGNLSDNTWTGASQSVKLSIGSSTVSFKTITVTYTTATQSVTVGTSKYAAYCSSYALDFTSTEVKAYKAKVEGGKVKLTQVDEVPANTGVILYGNAGNYNVPVIASADAVEDNELIGVTTRTLVEWETGGDEKYNYILQSGQFKKAQTGGYLKANRAYLHTSYDVTTASAREYLEFAFEDEVTGVADVRCKMADGRNDFYNLNGQKVLNPTKGLYIVNGKKVVIK